MSTVFYLYHVTFTQSVMFPTHNTMISGMYPFIIVFRMKFGTEVLCISVFHWPGFLYQNKDSFVWAGVATGSGVLNILKLNCHQLANFAVVLLLIIFGLLVLLFCVWLITKHYWFILYYFYLTHGLYKLEPQNCIFTLYICFF